jgi:signal transduction histidine kinase/phage shock protein PspC (stress-responsive transcriptional regulator)
VSTSTVDDPTGQALPSRLRRRPEGRLVAGVAAGLAEHLGVDVLWVRLGFTLLSAVNGFGLLTYALLWVFTPSAAPDDEPAGLASAARTGRRPRQGLARGDVGQLVALGAIGLGLVLLLGRTDSGLPARVLLPGLVVLAGLALIWAQADATERERLGSTVRWWAPVTQGSRWLVVGRLVGGLVLVVGGLLTIFVGGDQPVDLQGTLGVLMVVLVGAVLVVGPFLWRMGRQVEAERRARMMSQQQADMAAHLHDSVLQTLALIQRKADDPRAVVALARAQERDLRGWLYSGDQAGDQTVKAALEASAAEVEQAHGVPLDVVVVGDAPLDDAGAALVRAAREAMVNAARHSGAPVVDVYAECSAGEDPQVTDVEVFVRDRGVGFDPALVPDDRMGLRGSVVGRVERHGGRAVVRSAPGEGTEVRLSMALRRPEQVRA